MQLTQPLTQDDYKLIQALCELAPTCPHNDARQLAGQALRTAGISTGPTVRIDLLDHATTFAQAALDARAEKPARVAKPATPKRKPQPVQLGPIFSIPSNPMQAGRLKKALAKRFNFDGTICTLGERIIAVKPVRRSHYIRHYSTKRIDLEYKRLRTPKHEYTVWYLRADGRESGLDVPKVVYDALPHLATKTTEEPVYEEHPRGHTVHLSPWG